MAQQPTPQWQPSGKVFLVGTMIDGMLESAAQQAATLQEARAKPYVLDDYTVGRVIEVYTKQRDDLWLYDEQLRRWSAEALNGIRRREVLRLQDQMVKMHVAVASILALADELTGGTIERVLAMDDAALGLEMLRRHAGEE